MEKIIKGTVSSGFGKGKFFTQLDWVVEEFQTKLGFVPYPGTLNVDISEDDNQSLVILFGLDGGVTIAPKDNICCSAFCFKVLINGQIDGAVVKPEDTEHPERRLEIIAPVNLRETLGLADGDVVTLEFGKQEMGGAK